jgi:hypothetical protein
VKRTVARHTYSPTLQDEPESGTFRVAENRAPDRPISDAPALAGSAAGDEAAVKQALMAALCLLARQAARLNRGAK